MWSVMVLAFDGPTPMLTSVMPSPSWPLQVIGRHLRQVARRLRLRAARGARRRREDHVARRDEARIAVLADQLAPERDEPVHVALVVGEEHEILEMLGRRAGVVLQARERIVDALGGEERQRPRLARARRRTCRWRSTSSVAERSGSAKCACSARRSASVMSVTLSSMTKGSGIGRLLTPTCTGTSWCFRM